MAKNDMGFILVGYVVMVMPKSRNIWLEIGALSEKGTPSTRVKGALKKKHLRVADLRENKVGEAPGVTSLSSVFLKWG